MTSLDYQYPFVTVAAATTGSSTTTTSSTPGPSGSSTTTNVSTPDFSEKEVTDSGQLLLLIVTIVLLRNSGFACLLHVYVASGI